MSFSYLVGILACPIIFVLIYCQNGPNLLRCLALACRSQKSNHFHRDDLFFNCIPTISNNHRFHNNSVNSMFMHRVHCTPINGTSVSGLDLSRACARKQSLGQLSPRDDHANSSNKLDCLPNRIVNCLSFTVKNQFWLLTKPVLYLGTHVQQQWSASDNGL